MITFRVPPDDPGGQMIDDHSMEEHEEEYLRGLEGKDRWPICEDIFERPVQELKRRPWLAMESGEMVSEATKQMVACTEVHNRSFAPLRLSACSAGEANATPAASSSNLSRFIVYLRLLNQDFMRLDVP